MNCDQGDHRHAPRDLILLVVDSLPQPTHLPQHSAIDRTEQNDGNREADEHISYQLRRVVNDLEGIAVCQLLVQKCGCRTGILDISDPLN